MLRTSIQLADSMTAPLNNIVNALTSASQACAALNNASSDLMGQADLTGTVSELATVQGSLNDTVNDAQKLNQQIRQVNASKASASIQQVNEALVGASASAAKMKEYIEQYNQSANESANAMRRNTQAAEDTKITVGQLADEQRAYQEEVTNSITSVGGLNTALTSLVSAYSIKKIVDMSDTITQNKARLDLMNDGLQTTAELQNLVYAAADNTRASYTSMTDVVSRIGNLAGDAFSSSAEVVQFAEQLQKQFVLAGAGTQETEAATLQLTQALASGVLRGDELNSVFEQAPTVIMAIADYLDVDIGKIRSMASEGEITADIVKNAMFAAADETNAKFNSMPMTWGQVWTGICNQILVKSQPILDAISWMANHWEQLRSVVIAEAIAIGIYTAALVALNAQQKIRNGLELISAARSAISAGASFAEAAATTTATGAQVGFNAALLACPITWIIVAIIAVIWAIYRIITALNDLNGTSYTVCGVIVGAFLYVLATVGNVFIGLYNAVVGIVADVVTLLNNFAMFLINLFKNPAAAIVKLFADVLDFILGVVQRVTGVIDTVADTNLSAKVQVYRDNVSDFYGDITKGKVSEAKSYDASQWQINRIDSSAAWAKGNELGSKLENSVKNKFSAKDNTDNLKLKTPVASDLEKQRTSDGSKTAKNTAAIKDKLDITNKDLKYIRDYAEQKTINRFTTAEIKVDMTNNNTVNSSTDLDGVMNEFKNRLEAEMHAVAEGG